MSFLHRLRRLVRTNEKRMIKIVKKQSSVATLVIDLLEERDEQAKVSSSKIQQLEQRNKELEERLETNQAEVQSVQIKGLKQETDRKIDSLLKENAQLRSEVGERESQIFSLQPYRQELTTDEARTGYKNLVSSIRGFVENWTSSLLRNPEIQKKSLSWAKNHKDNISHFRRRLARWKDLYDTARMTNIDIDQEILIAFILRFLQETLFKRRLTSLHPDMDSMMDFVDNSMRKSVDPKPDEYAIKSWRAQTSLAMVTDPTILQHRNACGRRLSTELAYLLGFIVQDNDREAFMISIEVEIISLALKLQEKVFTSTNDFFMMTHTRAQSGHGFEGELQHLRDLECTNIAANMRKFNVDKLGSIQNMEQLRRELYIICSLCPALLVVQTGRGHSPEEPSIVSKEGILVAWKLGERGDESLSKLKHDSGSWLYRILGTL